MKQYGSSDSGASLGDILGAALRERELQAGDGADDAAAEAEEPATEEAAEEAVEEKTDDAAEGDEAEKS
jgi:hypothetical protein